jgi:hypothetical protein
VLVKQAQTSAPLVLAADLFRRKVSVLRALDDGPSHPVLEAVVGSAPVLTVGVGLALVLPGHPQELRLPPVHHLVVCLLRLDLLRGTVVLHQQLYDPTRQRLQGVGERNRNRGPGSNRSNQNETKKKNGTLTCAARPPASRKSWYSFLKVQDLENDMKAGRKANL